MPKKCPNSAGRPVKDGRAPKHTERLPSLWYLNRSQHHRTTSISLKALRQVRFLLRISSIRAPLAGPRGASQRHTRPEAKRIAPPGYRRSGSHPDGPEGSPALTHGRRREYRSPGYRRFGSHSRAPRGGPSLTHGGKGAAPGIQSIWVPSTRPQGQPAETGFLSLNSGALTGEFRRV